MDLAELILDKAKEIEENEKSKDYIEFQLIFHIHEEDKCINDVYSFKIHKCYKADKLSKNVIIEYNNTTWIKVKKTRKLTELLLIILRQMCRDVLIKYNYALFTDEVIKFNILNKERVLFTDELFIYGNIDSDDLSSKYLYDCNDNNELEELQNMYLRYINLCLESIK